MLWNQASGDVLYFIRMYINASKRIGKEKQAQEGIAGELCHLAERVNETRIKMTL